MSHILVRKDGFYSQDEETDTWFPVGHRPIGWLLRCTCEVEDGVTLKDVFRIVAANPPLRDFMGDYSSCRDIAAFHSQAERPDRSPPGEECLDRLEVGKFVDMATTETHRYVDTYLGFSGRNDTEDSYSVSMTPMYDLADLPLRLAPLSRYITTLRSKTVSSFECESALTLLEVLDAIYWDISFYGGPDEALAVKRDLMDIMGAYDRRELETFPLEELGL